MRFEWDEAKRGLNIKRHGIDFVDVEKILAGETITFLDDRFDYGETRKRHTSRKSETDLKRLREMKDEDIDFSDIPEVPPEMFARGIVRRGLKPVVRKKQLTLRVDGDVVEWYQKQGPGYQTRINSLLRAYMEEHRRKTA